MARDVTAAFITAVTAGVIYPAFLVELEFPSATIRLWTGYGDLSWNSQTWTGSGGLLSVGFAEETQELEAKNAVIEMNGAPDSVVALALAEDGYQGRPARIWFALFDSTRALVNDPSRHFSGMMDTMTIVDDPERPVIQLSCEDDMAALNRPRERRYTHEDQQIDYPGDKGFEFVASMQDREIKWGTG